MYVCTGPFQRPEFLDSEEGLHKYTINNANIDNNDNNSNNDINKK